MQRCPPGLEVFESADLDQRVATLDGGDELDWTQLRYVFDESSGAGTQQYAVGGRGRFHPLGQADVFAESGVTYCAGSDLSGNDSA